uniref:Integrase catalytic domain-containing protein n=1 Tax=Ananas comosus var. bracteatus TaxID=296719 RepID=A0A6V7PUZ7_ANACO|nr:unnamed protein product [Ananas comosus var. bracteatus]
MKDGAPIQEHLCSFNSIVSKHATLDVRLDEEEKASILLCSMPKSWINLIMNLSHVETLKMESIVVSLLTEEMRQNEHGIKWHLTVPSTLQQNGVAERLNRILMERARSMFSISKLDKRFSAKAVSTTGYLINQAPTKSLGLEIPKEVWNGKPVEYSYLRVFGCDTYAWILKEKISKLDENSRRSLGSFQGTKKKQDNEAMIPIELFEARNEVQAMQVEEDDEEVDNESNLESPQSSEKTNSPVEPPAYSRRPRGVIRSPVRYDDYITSFTPSANHISAYIALAKEDEPTSIKRLVTPMPKSGNVTSQCPLL